MEKIRQAREIDRREVVDCILDAFQKDFTEFINAVGREKVEGFLKDSLKIDCFYVIEAEQKITGVLALSNIKGRAMHKARKVAQKHFGTVFGLILYMAHFREFEINYCNSRHTACVEFVAVRQNCQGKGLASLLIKEVISETNYKNYLLDVKDTNTSAIACYNKLGFVEFKREKVRFVKQKGFKEKIFRAC